jgi:hypothetical protein
MNHRSAQTYQSIIRSVLTGLVLGFAGLFCSSELLAASRIDTLYFQSGDRITGEVKALENNQLRLSTDDAGTVRVEWSKIDSVRILNNMRIVLDEGEILYGKIMPAGEAGWCYIWSRTGDPLRVKLIRIVSLSLMKEQFFSRLNGTISSGFSYVKAGDVLQFNFDGSVVYEAEKNRIQLAFDGIYTRESNSGTNQRQNGGVSFMRLFPGNWFMVSSVTGESNSELGLDLRTTLALGGGNRLINTNFSHLYTALGIQANREKSAENNQYNAEGLLVVNYSLFIYENPDVSFNLSGQLIPSLTTLGRIRTDIDSSLRWEIFNDFYLKWTVYFNFDSQPLSETAEKKDWAVTLLGVEYKL